MAKKIEILENTLLKLIVRQGTDNDRQNITLSEGELGYTTDTTRLFVGDSQTQGGHVVGNVFKGAVTDHTVVTGVVTGDYAFNTTNNTLFVKTDTDWLSASRILEAGDGSIVIDDAAGTISVGTLSGGIFSTDMVGNSIELDGGKISLSGTQILTDQINAKNATHLKLPEKLNINSVDYDFPVGGLANDAYLGTDSNGRLRWSQPDRSATFYFNTSAAVPIGTVVAAASGATIPFGWLQCDGQLVAGADYPDLSATIGQQYGGGSVNFRVPDYTNTVHVGTDDPAAFTDGNLTSSGSDYTTKGVVYVIKALADEVASPSMTVKGLEATVNGTPVAEDAAFSPIANSVNISIPIPGMEANDTAGSGTFNTQATFTKFWVTGSGATGGGVAGGAASTVYGVLSAPIGTSIAYTVGAGPTTSRTHGNASFLSIGGTELARSFGAIAPARDSWAAGLTANGGSSLPTSDYVLSVHMLSGAWGGMDLSSGDEESNGNPSFWGGAGAPGASNHSVAGSYEDSADGMVKFEWGM